MSTSAPKRRKIGSTSALTKPFKSPLRTLLQPNNEAKLSANTLTTAPSVITTSSKAPRSPHRESSNPASSPVPPASTNTTASLSSLQRQHTTLLNTLSTLRQTLETHSQALKLEASSRDTELAELITTWRAASQAAAEEIYAGVRERINRMGGAGAWREREREQREKGWGGGWDGGEKKEDGSDDGERGGDEEGGFEERKEREAELKEGKEAGIGQETDDEGFTMDMMLKKLNIELAVIGFDAEGQRWVD